ncbi:unnamed protein product, partial [Adineta ricciae]
MEVLKRKSNGVSSTNGHGQKKKKKVEYAEEQDVETTYFESEITFHSTVTKMKVNALLNEVTLKESQRHEINEFIEQVSNELKSIPQGKVRELSKMSEWLDKFNIKIPLSYAKMEKSFQFFPPTVIEPIGSYTYDGFIVKSSNKLSTIIDLLVEIPRICIHKRDYLNNEYIGKRAVYLCYLAKKLKHSLEFAHLNDTTNNHAVLLVKPKESSAFAIRIILAPEQNSFKEKRFLPTSSNLRWNWFAGDGKEENEPFYPTPNYNSSILFDCRCRETSEYLKKIFSSSKELCNGLKLFKIWLEQRQLSNGFGSFEGGMSAFLLAYLLQTNKLTRQMNSYQVFRIVLVALMENNFLPTNNCSLSNEKPAENIFNNDDCVLTDQSGLLNIFHTLTRANYKRLQHEARISLNSFNDPVIDHFQTLFMTSMKPVYSMDATIQISSIDQYDKLLEEKSTKNQLLMDNRNDKHFLLCQEVLHLLENGLKERISLLCPLPSLVKTYLLFLDEQLHRWKTQTIEQIENFIQQKSNEIRELYQKYYMEINSQYLTIREQTQTADLPGDFPDQLEYLHVYSRLNSFEKRLHLNIHSFTTNQLNEKIKLDYAHFRELTSKTAIYPWKEMIQKKLPVIINARLPSRKDVALQPVTKHPCTLKSISSTPIQSYDHSVENASNLSVLITRYFDGKRIEYEIDSLFLPDLYLPSSPLDKNDNKTLVCLYKSLLSDENSYQMNYSTIMFSQCEMKHHCLASSAKSSEVLLYNSKLNILIFLQYEDNKYHCLHRLYLQWPSHFSTQLCDITYSQDTDHYFISTNDFNHLYMFDRKTLSVNDLGCVSDSLPLNRIAFYKSTMYGIVGDRDLVEYLFDEKRLNLKINRKIDLFNSDEILLDITCDQNNLLVWPINEPVPARTSITFGVIFSDQYDLSVLKGPENETKEAVTFRKLWTERSELRRFPDGSILESVVWNAETAKDKRSIWMDATRYLLEIQAGISPTHIEFVYNDQLPSSLLSIPARLFPSYGTGDEQHIYLCREFVELSKQIRTLNNELPLKINNIVGVDETFRYTNVFPPLPAAFLTDLHKIRSIEHATQALIPRSTSRYAPPFSPSLAILCQLEKTSSNDRDFETLERIK